MNLTRLLIDISDGRHWVMGGTFIERDMENWMHKPLPHKALHATSLTLRSRGSLASLGDV
ncbi:MAG: hypothetical protein P0120_03690 [Nitrospira sp.]|nr:hypothetical protein [Nitrospira sp.]